MIPHLLRRIAYLLPTALGAVTIVFGLIRLAPGDPIHYLVGQVGEGISQQALAEIRAQHGLDRPLLYQYAVYIGRLVQGDLGRSIHHQTPVVSMLWAPLAHTLSLALGGILIAIGFGVPLGLLSAVTRGSRFDYLVTGLSAIGLAAPGFWVGILLIYLLGFRAQLFPMFGAGSGDWLNVLHALVLPSIAVGLRSMAVLARISRSAMLETLNQDYIRTSRAKGLGRRAVIVKHALRNAAVPILTVLGVDIAALLGGAVTIETVFSRPGIGRLMLDSILARDYPVFQACIIVFAMSVIVVNLITDLTYSLADPRITYK